MRSPGLPAAPERLPLGYFEPLQSAGLIAHDQRFDFAKIVDQRYLVQSRLLDDRGTVRR
jgi:hypothetical protein